MAHIILSTKEIPKFKAFDLPRGTTVVETNQKGKPRRKIGKLMKIL